MPTICAQIEVAEELPPMAKLRKHSAMQPESKAQRERRFFEWFATAAGLQVCGDIHQPDAPDIVAEIAGKGRIAFELVCVDPRSEFFRWEHFTKTGERLTTEYAQLPEPQRKRLSVLLSDAEISVMLPRTTRWRDLQLSALWALLERIPTRFNGQVRCAPNLAEWLWITRTKGIVGPVFRSLSSGEIPRVASDEIEAKLARHYKCSEPLELLAYTEHIDIAHQADIEAIGQLAASRLPRSCFRKLWLFDGFLRKLELQIARPA